MKKKAQSKRRRTNATAEDTSSKVPASTTGITYPLPGAASSPPGAFYDRLVECYEQQRTTRIGYLRSRGHRDPLDILHDAFTTILGRPSKNEKDIKFLLNRVFSRQLTAMESHGRYRDRFIAQDQGFWASIPEESSAETSTDAKEEVRVVMAHLPEREARLLRLHYMYRMTYKEIGHMDGVSVSALKTRLHRARKLAREIVLRLREESCAQPAQPSGGMYFTRTMNVRRNTNQMP